jgi:hypothetical protein
VYRWEPHLALDGGGVTGFDMPADLLAQLPIMLMQVAQSNGNRSVAGLPRYAARANCVPAGQIKLHQDLAGHNRVLEIET